MGFYRNTNATKTVRAAVITDEIWEEYEKAKAEYISRERSHPPGVPFYLTYPEIKVSREKNSASRLYKLKLLESVVNGDSFKHLKRFLLPPRATEEESNELIEDLSKHFKDSEYCNKAIIRWYLENSYAVSVATGNFNLHERIFILDKNGEVVKNHTSL